MPLFTGVLYHNQGPLMPAEWAMLQRDNGRPVYDQMNPRQWEFVLAGKHIAGFNPQYEFDLVCYWLLVRKTTKET
jgi:hypothetical protein